jgi:hypothetical protein
MARRTKPKPVEIKSAKVVESKIKGKHLVKIIRMGMVFPYLDARCLTCNRQAICGGEDAEKFLRSWAQAHEAEVEIVREGDGNADGL